MPPAKLDKKLKKRQTRPSLTLRILACSAEKRRARSESLHIHTQRTHTHTSQRDRVAILTISISDSAATLDLGLTHACAASPPNFHIQLKNKTHEYHPNLTTVNLHTRPIHKRRRRRTPKFSLALRFIFVTNLPRRCLYNNSLFFINFLSHPSHSVYLP